MHSILDEALARGHFLPAMWLECMEMLLHHATSKPAVLIEIEVVNP